MGSFPIAHRAESYGGNFHTAASRWPRVLGVVIGGRGLASLGTGFKQSSLHHIARVLRIGALNTFGAPPALSACDCPLWLSPLGKPLTQGSHFSEPLLSLKGVRASADTAHE